MKCMTIFESPYKGIDCRVTAEGGSILGIPLSRGPLQDVAELIAGQDVGTDVSVAFQTLDLAKEGDKFLREQNPLDRDLLLRVATAAGVRGKVTLHANIMQETEDEDGVNRKPLPFPPAGIYLLAEQETETGKEFLLRMRPRASFRLYRTGGLEGLPAIFSVYWSGRWDREVANSPERYLDPESWGLRMHAHER